MPSEKALAEAREILKSADVLARLRPDNKPFYKAEYAFHLSGGAETPIAHTACNVVAETIRARS